MRITRKTLLAKTIVWLVAEILLDFLGIDDIADKARVYF